MSALTVPMKPEAFLTLLGMDPATKMTGCVPPQNDSDAEALGVLQAAAEQATALLAGGARPASQQVLDDMHEMPEQFLLDTFEQPDQAGCFDMILSWDSTQTIVRLHMETDTHGHVALTAFTTAD